MINIKKIFSLLLVSAIWYVAPALAQSANSSLNVTLTGDGTATFDSSPSGINCKISSALQRGTCSLSFGVLGTGGTVVLTASAPAGTTFNWGVSNCSATATTCSQPITPGEILAWKIEVYPSPYLGWWMLDEGSGNFVDDSSGAGNNGTLENSPTWTTSTIGNLTKNVLRFTPKGDPNLNQYVSLGNIVPDGYNNFSVSAWVNSSTHQWQDIVSRSAWDAPDGIGLIMDDNGRSVDFGHYASGYASSATNVQDGKWHFIVGTMSQNVPSNGTTNYVYNIYVDGRPTPDATFTSAVGLSSTTNGWGIGARYNGLWPYAGLIDDVRLFNRALTGPEVQNLYYQTVPCTPTVACPLGGCGTDSCGNSCGTCATGQSCSTTNTPGQCGVPNCNGYTCGSSYGISCGTCSTGYSCNSTTGTPGNCEKDCAAKDLALNSTTASFALTDAGLAATGICKYGYGTATATCSVSGGTWGSVTGTCCASGYSWTGSACAINCAAKDLALNSTTASFALTDAGLAATGICKYGYGTATAICSASGGTWGSVTGTCCPSNYTWNGSQCVKN